MSVAVLQHPGSPSVLLPREPGVAHRTVMRPSVYKGPPEAGDVAPSCRCAAALQAPEGGPQAAW